MAIPHTRRIPRWLALALATAALFPATATTAAAPQAPADQKKRNRRWPSHAGSSSDGNMPWRPRSTSGSWPAPDPADAGDARFGLANCPAVPRPVQGGPRAVRGVPQGGPGPSRRRDRPVPGRRDGLHARRPARRPRGAGSLHGQPTGPRHLDTAWPYLGDVCYRPGDLAGARAAYERRAGRRSRRPAGADRARFGLAMTLSALGQHDEALAGSASWPTRAGRAVRRQGRVPGRLDLSAAGRPGEAAEAFAAFERDHPQEPAGRRGPARPGRGPG